jgi:glycosyltransferase involved in cell wall biosynthesis
MTFKSKLIVLSRNFGSFAAIRTGLERASGNLYAVMAADLQEPPALILEFFRTLDQDEADIVVGTRTARHDPFLSRAFSKIFWAFYRRAIIPDTPPGGVDVFACNKKFRDELLKLEESHSSLVGLVLWLGFRRKAIPYQRAKRAHGRSGWTFKKKVKYLADSSFSFSSLPIHLLIWLGMAGVALSIIFSSIVVWARLAGLISVPGYAPQILTVTFFGSLNLVCLGIVGSYVWRAFENTKFRPQSVVMLELEFRDTSS